MICPNCGKKSEVGMLCKECFLAEKLRLELPRSIELKHCNKCASAYVSGKWHNYEQIEDAIAELVAKSVKGNLEEIERESGDVLVLDLDVIMASKEGYSAVVSIKHGKFFLEKKTEVAIKKATCPPCSRLFGGYFEAVLQIRGNFDPKIVEKIEKTVQGFRDTNAFITKILRVRGGVDIYLGSKKSAEKIVRSFKGKAEIKKSSQLISLDRQTSKGISRFYYRLRF